MKIRKNNPIHWILLGLFGLNVALTILFRRITPKPAAHPRTVLLYGHKLNGNLLSIYRRLQKDHSDAIRPVFLTMDPAYHRHLKAQGEDSCLATSPVAIWTLAHASAVISDHGLHAMQPMLRTTDIRFFDVWHGIPFKGFDAEDFRTQHQYDEVWVASRLHRQLYLDHYGFREDQVIPTGYARTDRLVTRKEDPARIRTRLGIPSAGPTILFAPTWKQDDRGRSLYPFGHDARTFLAALSAVAEKHDATILVRPHLNAAETVPDHSRVRVLPSSHYPDTEELLLVTDILVCDWSSIAFDFLLLDRPTFFLDVPPPFRKGFSLGPEYRFGSILGDLPALADHLDSVLTSTTSYWAAHRATHHSIRSAIYDDCADGRAGERCVHRLCQHLSI